jgi:hypothetical protein
MQKYPLQEEDARIIIGHFQEDAASRVLCMCEVGGQVKVKS